MICILKKYLKLLYQFLMENKINGMNLKNYLVSDILCFLRCILVWFCVLILYKTSISQRKFLGNKTFLYLSWGYPHWRNFEKTWCENDFSKKIFSCFRSFFFLIFLGTPIDTIFSKILSENDLPKEIDCTLIFSFLISFLCTPFDTIFKII